MAMRPAWNLNDGYINKQNYEFEFNAGFSKTQKQKNIVALHESIGGKCLEVSTKSFDELGRKLSAFNLRLDGVPLECVFQSSKKYENGGPYSDLLYLPPKCAKRDERHHTSGKLIAFEYKGIKFDLEPKTFFYDYIYIKAVRECLSQEELFKILEYDYFTDIEFVPSKSINCQAKSVAVIKALLNAFGEIPDIDANFEDYMNFYYYIKANEC